ncbi:hypothetical protein [Myxococcus eversor]|uniref:hypothetical protein n=1 Tax=Myxococcus eversor TaxID=2709661 RepID=UPI0013D866BE|nr:hypothetical protein [Myxococcus eversor]
MELEHVRIPVITFPWQGACAPDVEQLEHRRLTWATRHGLTPTAEHRARAERAKYASFAARGFPHASPALLQIFADFLAWFFVIDDLVVDRVNPLSASTLSHLTAFLDVLDLDQSSPEPLFGVGALRDICQRLRGFLSPEHFSRFAQGMRM